MKIFILFLFLALNLIAQNRFSIRLLHGVASGNDFGQIIIGDLGSHPKELNGHSEDLTVVAFDAGYLLKQNAFDLPIDFYAKAGASKFYEDNYKNVYEVLAYIKMFYNLDFLNNRVRFGFGEGGSYTDHSLRAEILDAQEAIPKGKTSDYLNYLDVTADFDIGKLVRYKPLYETYIGIALKHRSGIFGLINNVRHGGSNYEALYVEKNF